MTAPDGRVRFEYREDLPATAISLAGTTWNRTGSWKFLEPHYRDLTPPCSGACLTDMDVVAMMRAVEAGDWDRAVRVAMEVNPFPAITGRLCPRPCEQPCNRKAFGGAVSVRAVERAVGDHKLFAHVQPDAVLANLARVHVVGSGPAGLSAAVALHRLGHPVTVLSPTPEPGGSLRHVPEFRLPSDVLQAEIAWTRRLGIEFETRGRLSRTELEAIGPAVVAVGAGRPKTMSIPGGDLPQVFDATALLAAIRQGDVAFFGTSAAIVGGTAAAVDAARTLRRLGSEATVYVRGTVRDLLAPRAEVEDAKAEGVRFEFETSPARIERTAGSRLRVSLASTRSGAPPATTVEVDTVVTALGFEQDVVSHGSLAAASAASAAEPPARFARIGECLFAAGACAGAPEQSVADAIRSGRRAAHALHSAIVGHDVPAAAPLADRGSDPEVAKFKSLNLAWFLRESPCAPHVLPVGERLATFRPVEGDLGVSPSRAEAARCFKCGTCVECDVCFQFCPDVAIEKRPEGGYSIDLAHCKGCGVCVEECPRCAIHLRKST